jgi:hypothetical protein
MNYSFSSQFSDRSEVVVSVLVFVVFLDGQSRDCDPSFQSLQAARQIDFEKSSLSMLLHPIGLLPRIAGSFVVLRSDRASSCQIRSALESTEAGDRSEKKGIMWNRWLLQADPIGAASVKKK